MKQPLQIQFRGMAPSPALETLAQEKAAKLDQFAPNLISCRVVVELEQKHQQQGRPVGVNIDVTMPGQDLRVDKVSHEDAYVAMRTAFDTMARRVEEAVRRMRGT